MPSYETLPFFDAIYLNCNYIVLCISIWLLTCPLVIKFLKSGYQVSSAPSAEPSVHRGPLKSGWKNESRRVAYVKYQSKAENSECDKNSEKGEATGLWVGEMSYFLEKNKTFQRWLWVIDIQGTKSVPICNSG